MLGPLHAKTLIEYRAISLPALYSQRLQSSQRMISDINRMIEEVDGEPVELRESVPLTFFYPLFVRLRSVAVEITFRSKLGENALLLYSILQEEDLLRPFDVTDQSIHWPESAMKKFDQACKKDVQKRVRVDLEKIWQGGQKANDQMRTALSHIYTIAPTKERVDLSGETPIPFAAYVLEWFFPHAKEVYYDNHPLKPIIAV